MKKFFVALFATLFLVFAPAAFAQECFSLDAAKAEIAKWENGKEAVWEYLKSGPKFDALVAWAKLQNPKVDKVDGIVIVHVPSRGSKIVVWGISPDGKCIDVSASFQMKENQFNMIVGKEV